MRFRLASTLKTIASAYENYDFQKSFQRWRGNTSLTEAKSETFEIANFVLTSVRQEKLYQKVFALLNRHALVKLDYEQSLFPSLVRRASEKKKSAGKKKSAPRENWEREASFPRFGLQIGREILAKTKISKNPPFIYFKA